MNPNNEISSHFIFYFHLAILLNTIDPFLKDSVVYFFQMSYLSEGPEVANYRSGEIFTSLNQHYPLYNNNSNSSSFNRPIDDRR